MAILLGHLDPEPYRIEQTNVYNIHNHYVALFKVSQIPFAADAAHVWHPMGGYGCKTACLDVDRPAVCSIGYHGEKAGKEFLDTYAKVGRDVFLKFVGARSIKNLSRVLKADPWTVLETDKFLEIIKELNKEQQFLKDFLLVTSTTIAAWY